MKCPQCHTEFEGDYCPECGFRNKTNFFTNIKEKLFKKEIVFLSIAAITLVLCLFFFPFYQSSPIENNTAIQEASHQKSYNHITASSQLRAAMKDRVSASQKKDTASFAEASLISPEDYTELVHNPDSFQEMSINCSAQILYDPQYTDEGVYFVFRSASPKENTPMLYGIAFWAGEEDIRLSARSFVTLCGTVIGEHSYTDSYGYEDVCPAIYLTSLEQSSYAEIYAPAFKIFEFENHIQTAEQCTVQVFKVEFADSETRFYVTIENKGYEAVTFTVNDCIVEQSNKKYPYKENLDADYPQFSGNLQPEEKKRMVLTFAPLNASEDMELTLYLKTTSGQRKSIIFDFSEVSAEYYFSES